LDIEVTRGDLSHRVAALIDTGAPSCLFPKGIGDALDVDFALGVPRHEVKILGQKRLVVRADIVLGLPSVPEMWWNTEAGFFDQEWDDIRLGVLGHRGFLDHCVVSFHASRNAFIIESIDEWERRAPIDPFDVFQQRDDPEWQRPRLD
jgi:hypothetical protein